MSFDLAANGISTLVDPGTYTYTGSKELRDWFRSSHAHNTLSLNGESSSVPNEPFSWSTTARCSLDKWISQDRFDFVAGHHDGFMRLQDPATVRREILFLKDDYWIVRDAVSSSNEHQVAVSFHFDSSPDSESGIDIQCFGNGQWVEEEGSVSQCYGRKERAKAARFTAVLAGGKDIISFLLPRQNGFEWLIKEIEASEGRAFEVAGGKAQDLVMIRSGKWVWKRFVDGQLQETISLQAETDVRH